MGQGRGGWGTGDRARYRARYRAGYRAGYRARCVVRVLGGSVLPALLPHAPSSSLPAPHAPPTCLHAPTHAPPTCLHVPQHPPPTCLHVSPHVPPTCLHAPPHAHPTCPHVSPPSPWQLQARPPGVGVRAVGEAAGAAAGSSTTPRRPRCWTLGRWCEGVCAWVGWVIGIRRVALVQRGVMGGVGGRALVRRVGCAWVGLGYLPTWSRELVHRGVRSEGGGALVRRVGCAWVGVGVLG